MTDKTKQNGALPELVRSLFPTYANLELTDEQINALPLSRQQELLQSLNYRQKYQLLRKSDQVVRLIHQMSAEDFYFTIEAAGRTDSMDLVLSATPEQLTQVFDMTCWDKDEFDHEELLDWFGYMIQVDPERAMGKLRTVDPDLIMLMLAKYIRVERFEWSDDRSIMPEDVFSLDDFYQFMFVDPESEHNERLQVFLKMLYTMNHPLYKELMESLIWELPSTLEEMNLRARSDRMSDRGYPDYLEALRLFARIDPAEVKRRLSAAPPLEKDIRPLGETLPVFYSELLNERAFLSRTLDAVPDEARENLRNELVYLANRLLVARRSLTEFERVRDALNEARETLSLGLDFLSDGDPTRAAAQLVRSTMSEIFRVGLWLTMDLHQRAKTLFTRYIDPAGQRAKSLISSPGRETLTALLRKPPLYFTGADPKNSSFETRPFASMADVDAAERLLARSEFLLDLHFTALAVDHAEVLKGAYDVSLDELDPDLRLVKVFLTVYVNARTGGEARYQPIPRATLEIFFRETLTARDGGGYETAPRFSEDLRGWLAQYVSSKGDDYQALADDWALRVAGVYGRLARNLRGLSAREALSLSQVLLFGD